MEKPITVSSSRICTYQKTADPYSIAGGYINIPQQYKTKNKKGNIIISADFFKDEQYKDFFIFNDDGTVTIPAKSYELNQSHPAAGCHDYRGKQHRQHQSNGWRQKNDRKDALQQSDQSAAARIFHQTFGCLFGGNSAERGRSASGKKHAFTDLGIDEQGADLWGNYLTAGSIVIDEKTTINGSVWPQNAGGGYSGPQTMRSALQQSINTCAVKIFLQVGANYSADLVKKFGITTLDTEGSVSDLNPAALALGGMTNGVTTLDMASAYSAFPNNGTRKETSSYSEVLDSSGKKAIDQ